MLGDLETILAKAPVSSRPNLESEMRAAARALLEKQFLYADGPSAQRRFDLMRRHREYFTDLFDALGYDFTLSEREQFAGIVGQAGSAQRRLGIPESLFLLALRVIYEDRLRSFSLKAGGRCETLLSEIWGLIEERTGRERPSATRCRSLVEQFARNGLVSELEELPEGDLLIEIRPAIARAVTEASVEWIERYARQDVPDGSVTEAENAEQVIAEAAE
jgi:hypothetical protein